MPRAVSVTWMRLKSPQAFAELMRSARLSQAQLAAQAKPCSQQRISQLCTSPAAVVLPELAERIARALDVKVSVLFDVAPSARSTRRAGSECEQPSTRGPAGK